LFLVSVRQNLPVLQSTGAFDRLIFHQKIDQRLRCPIIPLVLSSLQSIGISFLIPNLCSNPPRTSKADRNNRVQDGSIFWSVMMSSSVCSLIYYGKKTMMEPQRKV
jgi:hypothetical protein